MIGNVLEWYDFSIYGFFAPQIGATFFAGTDRLTQILAAFSVFAAGYLARPLGAIVIGIIGDRRGRSTALLVSIGGMIVSTLGMGLVPGHASIGIAAPILLTVLRIVQGLAVGGESAIANVFMVENAPPGRRALASAINGAGYAVGIQLASLTALACSSLLTPAELQDWGWRIPFWLSLLVAVTGFWLRRTLEDLAQPAGEQPSPLAEVLANHLPLVLRIAGLTAFAAVGFQGAFIYIAEWLQTVAGASPVETFKVTSWSMLLVTPVSLLFGWWADVIGRRGLLLASAVLGVVGSVPFFMLMQAGSIYLGPGGLRAGAVDTVRRAGRDDGRDHARHRSLHGAGDRQQHRLEHPRRPDAARRHLAHRPHRRRARAGLAGRRGGRHHRRHAAGNRRPLPQQDPLTIARGSAACAFRARPRAPRSCPRSSRAP